MNTNDYWNIFEKTGKVTDYLNYKNSCADGRNCDNGGHIDGRLDYKGAEGRGERSPGYDSYS